jgi:iron complex outermembrane receptor protein
LNVQTIKLHVCSAVLLSSVLSLAPSALFAAESERELQTIVVTAEKREENLQTVPVAVTALTGQILQDIGYVNTKDLNAVAPGLTTREGAGGTQTVQFSMRGVYGDNTFASDSGIAFYVDGIYIASTLGTEFDLADIERIEVLRGPQGTLFGRNSVGGAVNVITKEPSGEFHLHQQLGYGNLDTYRSKTSIDLPAWGILSGSVTFLHDQQQGDVRNLGPGVLWNYGPATFGEFGVRESPTTLGAHKTNAVLAAIKLLTDGGIKVVYRYNHSHQDFTPDANGIVAFPADGGPFAGLLHGVWLSQPVDQRTPITHTRPDAVNNWFTTDGLSYIESHTVNFTLPITEGITFKDLFGYRHNHVETTNNLTGLGGLYTANLAGFGLDFYPAGTPFIPLENATETDQRTYSNELQFNFDTHWLTSTVGYLYYNSLGNEGGLGHSLNTIVFSGLASPAWIYPPGPPPFTQPPTLKPYLSEHSVIRTISSAFYTQLEGHVTDKLDLVGGVRYTKDTRGGIDGSPTPAAAPTSVHYSKGQTTYLGGVNYKLNDANFLYFKYSTGYVSGGQLANLVFAPETANSFEIGVKSDLFDNTLRINASIYTVKYGDVQTLTSPQVSVGGCTSKPGVSHSSGQCIINGGDARASGVELELTYVTPIEGLTLSGNTAYTNIYYTRVDPGLRSPIDGTFTPQFAPAWTGLISAQYRGPDLTALGGAHFMARGEGNFSSMQWAQANSSLADSIAADIPKRWLASARLGLAGFTVGGASVDVSVYGKNLGNNRGETYSAQFGFESSAIYQRARTYGVEVNAGF